MAADEIAPWLASTASVAKADGNANLARIASQALDELQRLRKVEEAARTVVDLGEPVAYGGAMWELRELLGPPS